MESTRKLEFFPLYEIFENNSRGCPLCSLYDKLEHKYIRSLFEGERLSDPYICKDITRSYFCTKHIDMMFSARDRFSLALILNMKITDIMGRSQNYKKINSAPQKTYWLDRFFGSRIKTPDRNTENDCDKSCMVCDYLKRVDTENLGTLISLLIQDNSYLVDCKDTRTPFCDRHFVNLMFYEENNKYFETVKEDIYDAQMSGLERIQNDLEWFIKKFDHRYVNEPWKESKDVLKKIQKYLRR